MHLLFATSIVPGGGQGSGYEIASAAILDALRRAGCRVTVLGFTERGVPVVERKDVVRLGEIDVRTVGAGARRKIAWLVRAMLNGLTFSSAKLRVISPEEVRQAIDAAGPFDGYVLNSVQLAGAFEGLFDDKPSIFVAHNVEFRTAEENARTSRGIIRRLLYAREARILKRLEARLCERARFVFTLAEEDRSALGIASKGKSAALPLVTRRDQPPVTRRDIDCDAALIGTWTWEPNRIGLDWFLEAVVPRLRRDFQIRIAGHMPPGVRSEHPGVKFVGHVPAATEFVRGAAVVPLISRAGTGVQLKTIETFELGLPSVATRSALRGIDFLPANCTVADDPQAFARALELAASNRGDDADGSHFYRRQRAALDARIGWGLDALGRVRNEVAA
jgi:hypothetical protein